MKYFKSHEGIIFFGTLCVHAVIVVLLATGVIVVPASPTDSELYFQNASGIAALIRNGTYTFGAIYPHHWYPLFLGGLFAVSKSSMLIGSLVNALLISCAGVLLYKTMLLKELPARASLWTTLVIINLYASLLYLTSQLLKEAWILTLLTILLFLGAQIVRRGAARWHVALAFLLSFILLRNLRFFVSFAAIITFFVDWFLNANGDIKKRVWNGIAMVGVVTVVALLCTGWGIGKNMGISQYIHPQYIHDTRDTYYGNGATTTNIAVVKQQPAAVLPSPEEGTQEPLYSFSGKGILTSFSIVLLGPFPWQLSLKQYAVTLVDLVLWYTCFILAAYTLLRSSFRTNVPYLVGTSVLLCALTLGVDNLGALLRYRLPVLIVLALLIPFSLVRLVPSLK